MIRKRIKRMADWMNNSEIQLNVRMLYLIIYCGLAAAVIGTIGTIVIRSPLVSILASALVALSVLVILLVMRRLKNHDIFTVVLVVVVNLVLLPAIFFTGGGVYSSMNTWFALGFLFCFLLLSGKKLAVMLTLCMVCDTACFAIAYLHPEFITPLESELSFFMDTYIGMIVLAMCIGALVIFQKKLYEREQSISRQRQLEVEEANRTKSRFLANMSHEIRTPINTIIGLNEMNLREPLSAEVEENCINVQQAGRLLLSLINDILDLSKIESGKMEIVPRQYETGEMLSELVNINWIRAHEKKLEFVLDIAPDIPSMLFGDDVRIKQVLTNIISNAIKYTQKGTVTLVAKSELLDGNRILLRLAVSDTGIGIRKEDTAYLFESFKRVDEKRNHAIEGTGLGLAISKQLVELMGGQIRVDSIYQRGSTFTVTLEQEIVDDAPIGSVSEFLKNRHGRTVYKQSFEAPEARVLVVDDNEMNCMVATKLLRATKVQVDVASGGAECLEMVRKRYYHVIFMDHRMPGMDGIETLERLRAQENGLCRETPVIALTANGVSGADKVYLQSGFSGYLMKPVSGALLEAMLFRFLPSELVEYSGAEETAAQDEEARLQLLHTGARRLICITTDSVSDLPSHLPEQFHIRRMHYYVDTGNARFCDGDEISSDNLTSYLSRENGMARSEAPAVEEYETFFADVLAEAVQVIHISMSKGASQGFERATQAARGFDNVHVVDSGHVSSGMGLIVLRAAQMAGQNHTAEEIIAEAERMRGQVSTSFIVPSPESMYRGGGIGGRIRWLCNTFQLQLILSMREGCIVCSGICGGTTAEGYRTYIRRRLKGKKNIDTRILFFTYAGCSVELRRELLAEVAKYQNFERVIEQKASAAITSNCGLGTFGLFYLKK